MFAHFFKQWHDISVELLYSFLCFIFSLMFCCPIQIAFNWYFLNAFALSVESFCISLEMMTKMKRSKHLVTENAASITDGCDFWQPRSLMKHWYQMVTDHIFNSKIYIRCSEFIHMMEHNLIRLTELF